MRTIKLKKKSKKIKKMFAFLYKIFQYIIAALSPTIECKDECKEEEVPEEVPTLELQYFDAKGLAESIRLTLKYGQIDFMDTRVSKEDFAYFKETLLFGQVPQLNIFDKEKISIVQSKAILRYAGKLTHTYPSKIPLDAAVVDQWVELHTEFMTPLVLDMYPERFGIFWKDSEKKAHRKWSLSTHIPKYFKYLNDDLQEHDTFLGGMQDPSIADFCWLSTIQWLTSGMFDGADETILHEYPNVKAFQSVMEDILKESDEEKKQDDDGAGLDLKSVDSEEKKIS